MGFNRDHLFDIQSRLEMGRILKGENPEKIDVSYIFCKQLFAPWENLDDDPVAIDLIYDQIINGIRANIYSYGRDVDMSEFVLLAVQHYYIIHGKDIEQDKMKQIVQELIPAPHLNPNQNGDGKSSNKKIKPLFTEKQIDEIVKNAIQKDNDVNIFMLNSILTISNFVV